FKVSKVGTIAGCIVRSGTIQRTAKARVIRDGSVVYSGNLSSLKRFKEDVREVREGLECGIGIENFNDLKVGDRIESYRMEEVKRTLQSAGAGAV
ncbi:MAG TPA: EF-Tu/IF-2/RF-3 family GTPase, partial [Gemmatimonadales bacterium]|nr:EF-Tu/IF-2/RF-3 family GTPase [Gemmatimonadales bacterium]